MGILQEFKQFALKGSIVDLAVAVIIGAAFGAIISSLVDDVITPLLLNPALRAAGAEDIGQLVWKGVKYGKFLAAVIKFVIIALVLFGLLKTINQFSKKKEEAVTGPSSTDLLLQQILEETRRRS